MLVVGAGDRGEVVALVGPRFGVCARTIRADVRRVREAWTREDAEGLTWRRSLVLRRLEEISRKAVEKGNLRARIAAEVALGRFLGMLDGAWLRELEGKGRMEEDEQATEEIRLLEAHLERMDDSEARRFLLGSASAGSGASPT